MISINQLRIGNWLFFQTIKVQVYSLSETNQINGQDASAFIPIALSEQVLSKSGFSVVDSGILTNIWQTNINKAILRLSIKESMKFGTGIYIYDQAGDEGFSVLGIPYPFLFVHQLQNLYFTLTGNELSIFF